MTLCIVFLPFQGPPLSWTDGFLSEAENEAHAVGGMIPWKKIHEMTSPIQMMNPNRQTT